jgi:aromatic-L-amino-acid/L-tryptophan decarboxylase
MDWDDYEGWGKKISTWGANYHKALRDYPVRSQVKPGDILNKLDTSAPEEGTKMEDIMKDFNDIVIPGMTHWQHPRFFAYFPSNASPPAILADFLTSTMAAQCMLWQTSPAATEMETRMMDWLRQAVGLPEQFEGVIQDSASSATLSAVLTMRERALGWQGNKKGLSGLNQLRIYVSDQSHSSIDRAIWISGIGQKNLVRLPVVGDLRSSDSMALRNAIKADIAAGYTPAGVICVTGATGMGACDDISAMTSVAKEFDLYVHVDAAWAGSAMICPEFRYLWQGVDDADSVVLNPHKWLGVQFDCSAHFLKAPSDLVQTLAIQPEYLKTYGQDGVINYSEWSIPLGRRFRALKLWFLLRSYGLENLRTRIRNHVHWSIAFAKKLHQTSHFEVTTDPILSLFTFRYLVPCCEDHDEFNQQLVEMINNDGRIYLTQTNVDGQRVIRFQTGQFETTQDDVDQAFYVIQEIAEKLSKSL